MMTFPNTIVNKVTLNCVRYLSLMRQRDISASLTARRSNKSPNQQVLHGAIQVAGNKSVIFSFEISAATS